MCGIVGVVPVTVSGSDVVQRANREAAMRLLATKLLLHIESRGPDASGFSVMFKDGGWLCLKQPVPAKEFTKNIGQSKYTDQELVANYRNMMTTWRAMSDTVSPTSIYIGHARKGTKGSEYVSENNHPIVINKTIIGVHNGKIENDSEIFSTHKEDLKRIAEVDSEAIFQIQNLKFADQAPTVNTMVTLDKYLRGAYAILTMNKLFPSKLGFLRRTRPIELASIRGGLDFIIAASTRSAIGDAIEDYNRCVYVLNSAALPFVKESDVKHVTVPDDTAGCIDVSGEVEEIGACVSTAKLEFPRTSKSKLPEYDTKTTHTSNSYSHNTYNTTTTQEPSADVVDHTNYGTKPSSTGSTTNAVAIGPAQETTSIEVDVKVIEDGLDDTTDLVDNDGASDEEHDYDTTLQDWVPAGNTSSDGGYDDGGDNDTAKSIERTQALDNVLGMIEYSAHFLEDDIKTFKAEATEVMAEIAAASIQSDSPGALWIDDVGKENVCQKTGLTTQPTLEDIKACVEAVYSTGFSEGYSWDRLVTEEEDRIRIEEPNNNRTGSKDMDSYCNGLLHERDMAIAKYEDSRNTVDDLRRRMSLAQGVVANLKSFAMALVATSRWVEITENGQDYAIDRDLEELTRTINKNFSLDNALRIISNTDKEIESVVRIATEFELLDEEEDSEGAAGETLENEAEAS